MRFFTRKKRDERLCPNCREPVTDEMVFCDSCGLRLLPPPTCLKCNLPLAPQTNFCEACGTPVGVAPPPDPDEPELLGPVVSDPGESVHGEVQAADESPAEPEKKNRPLKKRSKRKKSGTKGTPDAVVKKETGEPAPVNGIVSTPRQGREGPEPAMRQVLNEPVTGRCGSKLVSSQRPVPASAGQWVQSILSRQKKRSTIFGGLVVGLVIILVIGAGVMHIIPITGYAAQAATSGDERTNSPDSSASMTSTPAIPQPTIITFPVIPRPTQVPPERFEIWLQAERDPITHEVTVLFDGGKGQNAVRVVLARLTRSDGQELTGTFRPFTVGEGIVLQGTRYSDRLEVIVTYNNGEQYKVIDKIFEYKQRN